MNSPAKLSLAYIERVPDAAAAVLQSLPPDQTATFIDTVPIRLSAPVVNAMIPWHAAQLLQRLPAGKAAMILRQLSFTDATSLARLLDEDTRATVLEALPERYARRLSSALRYPRHQVGAWIDPDTPVLKSDHTVGDALSVLATADSVAHVLIESTDNSRFTGAVTVNQLLRHAADDVLSSVPALAVEPLSNRASLETIEFDSRWDAMSVLPVVGRRGNLLGGLSRKSLRLALREHAADKSSQPPSLLQQIVIALGVTCIGMLGLGKQTASWHRPRRPT